MKPSGRLTERNYWIPKPRPGEAPIATQIPHFGLWCVADGPEMCTIVWRKKDKCLKNEPDQNWRNEDMGCAVQWV